MKKNSMTLTIFNELDSRKSSDESAFIEIKTDKLIKDIFMMKIGKACDELGLPKTYLYEQRSNIFYSIILSQMLEMNDEPYDHKFLENLNLRFEVISPRTKITNRLPVKWFEIFNNTLNSLNERLKRLCPGEIDTLLFNHFIIFEAALNRLSDDDCKELIRQIALDKIRRSVHTYNYRLEKLTKLETDLTK